MTPQDPKNKVMQGVREHAHGMPVELGRNESTGRTVVVAYNEGGFASVEIDAGELLRWLQANGADFGAMPVGCPITNRMYQRPK